MYALGWCWMPDDGCEFAFTAVWQAPNGLLLASRSYAGFQQIADEQARSRVYGGIHFTFDNEPSQQLCPRVVDFVARHLWCRTEGAPGVCRLSSGDRRDLSNKLDKAAVCQTAVLSDVKHRGLRAKGRGQRQLPTTMQL